MSDLEDIDLWTYEQERNSANDGRNYIFGTLEDQDAGCFPGNLAMFDNAAARPQLVNILQDRSVEWLYNTLEKRRDP